MDFRISDENLAEVTTIRLEVMNMYSIKEVVEAVFGEYNDPNYKRIRYATETGVVEPPRVVTVHAPGYEFCKTDLVTEGGFCDI